MYSGLNVVRNPGPDQMSSIFLGGCARLQAYLLTTDNSCLCTRNWEFAKAVSELLLGFTGKDPAVTDGNSIMCLKKK